MPGAYREWRPRPELRQLAACVWERTQPADVTEPTRVLPDGCVDVVVASDGREFIAGPDTQPVLHHLAPGTTVTGVRFRIGAAGAALGLPAAELRDQQVALEALWGQGSTELAERLAAARSAAERLAALQDAVMARTDGTRRADPLVVEAARRLGTPGARVGTLARELGVSDRELRRRFVRTVGYGPKVLDRVLRLQRFVRSASRSRQPDLAASAYELGYADQAHLTRACRELTGLPPTALLATLRP